MAKSKRSSSGASALRGFYTSGLILHRPDEDASERKLEIELRNGPALPSKLIDKVRGQWVEINPMNERLVRAEVGAKHDAERMRKHDVILGLLYEEARRGKLYTLAQFSEAFENTGGSAGGPSSTTGSAFSPPRARSSSSAAPPPRASAWPRSGANTAISASRECCSARAARPSIPTRARSRRS